MCLEELNNLNIGGDAYLTLFTLSGAHSVVCIDGNKLKNERKCTPHIEKMTENVRHTLEKEKKHTLADFCCKKHTLADFEIVFFSLSTYQNCNK